ncbi:hypothetical protein SADUNF_Sadunf07G0077300 [Salix dunnii]|uniref:Uncharacterized protein n=1 Tax=Salix dunnii TaxID=1413687 RepID=A0A835JZP3_9ROSI|nr:hypothetical protein SADUNF_Sadunf07G0077300 [Salix dunnii]
MARDERHISPLNHGQIIRGTHQPKHEKHSRRTSQPVIDRSQEHYFNDAQREGENFTAENEVGGMNAERSSVDDNDEKAWYQDGKTSLLYLPYRNTRRLIRSSANRAGIRPNYYSKCISAAKIRIKTDIIAGAGAGAWKLGT